MSKQPGSRRIYLASALCILTGMASGVWPLLANAKAQRQPDHTHANLLRLAAQTPAALVGAAVLPQLAHATPQELVDSLASRLSGFLDGRLHQPCDAGTLHLAFQEAVKADFAQGRCVSVSGWVLATTEVELCALAALSPHSA